MKKRTNRNIVKNSINLFVWYLGLLNNKKISQHSKKVVIIRTDLIGDYVLFTPALKYLRNKYRDLNISLLVQDTVGGLAFGCPYIDEIIVFNKKKYRRNIFYKILFLYKIRNHNFKIALNAAYSRDRISDEITLWSNAVEKIGWDTLMPNLYPNEKVRGDRIYTYLLSSKVIKKDAHELLINRELIRLLGITVQDFIPELFLSENDKKKAIKLLFDMDPNNKILIGLITNAMDQYREWNIEKYTLLIDRICNEFNDAAIILIGVDCKKSLKVNDNYRVLDLRGKTKIQDLPAVLAQCKLVIGNETGPIHIANAVGVHSICIVGGGQFNRFVPYPKNDALKNQIIPVFHKMDCYMCGWNCIYENANSVSYPCIDAISVDEVFNVVKRKIFMTNK